MAHRNMFLEAAVLGAARGTIAGAVGRGRAGSGGGERRAGLRMAPRAVPAGGEEEEAVAPGAIYPLRKAR